MSKTKFLILSTPPHPVHPPSKLLIIFSTSTNSNSILPVTQADWAEPALPSLPFVHPVSVCQQILSSLPSEHIQILVTFQISSPVTTLIQVTIIFLQDCCNSLLTSAPMPTYIYLHLIKICQVMSLLCSKSFYDPFSLRIKAKSLRRPSMTQFHSHAPLPLWCLPLWPYPPLFPIQPEWPWPLC